MKRCAHGMATYSCQRCSNGLVPPEQVPPEELKARRERARERFEELKAREEARELHVRAEPARQRKRWSGGQKTAPWGAEDLPFVSISGVRLEADADAELTLIPPGTSRVHVSGGFSQELARTLLDRGVKAVRVAPSVYKIVGGSPALQMLFHRHGARFLTIGMEAGNGIMAPSPSVAAEANPEKPEPEPTPVEENGHTPVPEPPPHVDENSHIWKERLRQIERERERKEEEQRRQPEMPAPPPPAREEPPGDPKPDLSEEGGEVRINTRTNDGFDQLNARTCVVVVTGSFPLWAALQVLKRRSRNVQRIVLEPRHRLSRQVAGLIERAGVRIDYDA